MSAKSCDDCPSRLDPDRAAQHFGANFGPGVDVCGTHGHVLGKPGERDVTVSIKKRYAETCSDFGNPMNAQKTYPMATVMISSPVRADASGAVLNSTSTIDPRPNSCMSCVHYVPANKVRDQLGWPSALCQAHGRLLLNERLTKEPIDCFFAHAGQGPQTTDGLMFMPLYEAAINYIASPTAPAYVPTLSETFIEPSEYETDAPVDQEAHDKGIRAWRKLTDGENVVYAPIFRTDFFTAAEQRLIPKTGSDQHPELYQDYQNVMYDLTVEMLALSETPLLMGESGAGKTEVLRHYAWMANLPFVRVQLTGGTELDAVAGKWKLVNASTEFLDSRITAAWERPCIIDIDEINLAHDSIVQFFRSATDSKQIMLDEAEGQVLNKNEFCMMAFTSNPPWDPKYIGANTLSEADTNRLSKIWLDMPPEDVERAIIAQRCKVVDEYEIPQMTLDKLMAIASDLRAISQGIDATLPISWGVREQIAVARKTAWYGLEKSYKRACTDLLDPGMAQIILSIVSNYES